MSSIKKTPGKRRADFPSGAGVVLLPGEYAKISGVWHGCCPIGLVANLANHSVEERLDGTITVTPSIVVTDGQTKTWHGYLREGVWEEV